jgi:hypothetical protein
VKTGYRLICYRNDAGMYFIRDKHTGKRVDLETKAGVQPAKPARPHKN